jgi:hypothetical protein
MVETLVAEFERQFATATEVLVYDWGQSSRFQQGFIIVSWDGQVPLEFTRQLNEDARLQGYSLYNLPMEEPVYIREKGQPS